MIAVPLLAVMFLLSPLQAVPSFPIQAKSVGSISTVASGWRVEPVVLHGGSAAPDIELDAGGRPHVLACPPGEVRYAVREASSWTTEVVTKTVGGGICGAIGVAAGGTAYVNFYIPADGLPSDHRFAVREGSWQFFPTPTNAADLEVDSTGAVHGVAWLAGRLTHVVWQSGAWTLEDTGITGSGSYGWTSMALDGADRPHVLFYTSGDGDVRYGFRDATGWNVSVVEHIGGIGAVGRQGSLALDPGGTPHGAWSLRLNSTTQPVHYGIRASGGWSISVVEPQAGLFPSIGVGRDSVVQLAYERVRVLDLAAGIVDQDVVHAVLGTSAWMTELVYDGLVELPTGEIAAPQMVRMQLDRCGNPHTVFYLGWYSGLVDRGSGVYYATRGEPCGSSPLDLKHEAVARIKALKDQALGRSDQKFLHELHEAEEEVWESVGFTQPFRPDAIAAIPASDVIAKARDQDEVRLTLGASWDPRLASYKTLRLTWTNGVISVIDLSKTWLEKNGDFSAEPWVDAWQQDVRMHAHRDKWARTLTLDVRVEQASMGVTVSLDGDRVADISFTYEMGHLWLDATHLDPKNGKEVFNEEQDAIAELLCQAGDENHHDDGPSGDALRSSGGDDQSQCHEEGPHQGASPPAVVCRGPDPRKWTYTEIASLDSECERIANLLVKADEILALTALKDAQDLPIQNPKNAGHVRHEIEAGEHELKTASSERDKREYCDAIGHFARAWKHAERAIVAANKK